MTKPEAGQRGLQVSIQRARTLGENHGAAALFQNPDQRLQRAAIVPLLIDGDDVKARQKPAQHRHIEERVAREKKHLAPGGDAGERRIEIAFVIHRNDDGSLRDPPLAMLHAKAEENFRQQPAQKITAPIPKVHCGTGGACTASSTGTPANLSRSTICSTTSAIEKWELSITTASGAIVSGEARREESA